MDMALSWVIILSCKARAEELLTSRAPPGRVQVMQSAAGGTAEEWW